MEYKSKVEKSKGKQADKHNKQLYDLCDQDRGEC